MNIKTLKNPDLDCDMVIEYRVMTPEIAAIIRSQTKEIPGYDGRENMILISLSDILFFESESPYVYCHTTDASYRTQFKLYELERDLSTDFIRVSKSTIVNVNRIAAIERNITSTRRIEFESSTKIVYVSRNYFNALKQRLKETRII